MVTSCSWPSQRDAPGEDLVADLAAHVAAEGLSDELALPRDPDHAVEALGHRADLVVARPPGSALVEIAPLDLGHRALDLAAAARPRCAAT